MSITKEQQQALDDALVPREQRLRIGNYNYRLSTTFKPKEPTSQVDLDVLSLTPFYQAFLNSASVPAIYMHEFWATKFIDPPFEEEILVFIRKVGYSGNMKSLSDSKNVDYVYLLWEDLVYQIENKVSKKNKDMYYPKFTKVIINHFMSKDQSIPRRNKVDWHMAKDDPILTTMRFIPKHETVIPKPKYVWRSTREKTEQAPKASLGKGLKATAKLSPKEAQAENQDFINKIDENMKKIIKEQVKVQVKEQFSKILSIIEKSVNVQLKAEVLIRSSNEAKTSHAIAANLFELELKKILIDKMENNKSIDGSVQQKTLYKALVDAYETDKDILATYGDIVTFKRHRDDEDEYNEPSAGSNRGSKRRKLGKEPESTSAPKDKTSKSTGSSKEGSKSKTRSTDKSVQAEEQVHTVNDLEEPAHQEFKTGFTEDHLVDETTQLPDCTLAQNEDPHESFNELMDTLLDFSAFVLNWLKVDTLAPELLAGQTFELMKGSCKSLVELEYFLKEVCKATTDQLD
ncbi:hypothetical protein Tco_1398381 [Tanacetum coccineum]